MIGFNRIGKELNGIKKSNTIILTVIILYNVNESQ